jgi:translation initiation factor 1 (eIF-1/SUI1)
MTLTLCDKTYTFPVNHNNVGVVVEMPNGTRTVWVCANWFDKTVFNTDCRAPRTDCCGGNHGRIFCKNVFTGRECSKACQSFYHMVLPEGTPLPPKVVAAQSVPSDAAFPALATDQTLKEQSATYAAIQEKMKVTPKVKVLASAPAPAAEETKAHPFADPSKFHTQICNSVLTGNRCRFYENGSCKFAHPEGGKKFKQRTRENETSRAKFDKDLAASKIDFQRIFEEVAHVMMDNIGSIRLIAATYVEDKKAKRVIHLLAEKNYLVQHLVDGTLEPRHFEDIVLLWHAAASVARADDYRISKSGVGSFVLFGEADGPKENEVWELGRRLTICKTSVKYARKCAPYLPVVAAVRARADPVYAEKHSSYWRVSVKSACTGGRYCDKGAHCDCDNTNYLDLDILTGVKKMPVPECTVLALPRDVPARFVCQAPQPANEVAAATAATQLKETTETYIETYITFLGAKKELDALNAPLVEETMCRKLQGITDSKRHELTKARDTLNETKKKKSELIANKATLNTLIARLKAETTSALEAEELRLSQLTKPESEDESENEGEDDICFEESLEESPEESEDESELTGDDIIAKLFKASSVTTTSKHLTKELKECTERCATLREAVARFADPAFATSKLSPAKRFPTASENDRTKLSVLESTTLRCDEKIAVFDAETALHTAKCTELEATIEELRKQHKAAVLEAIAATDALSDTTTNNIRFRDLSTACIRLEAELYTLSCEMEALNEVVFRAKSTGVCPVTSWFYEPLKPLPRKETQLVAQTFDTDFFAPSGLVALKPALTGFGAVAAIVPLQAITYPTTQSTDLVASASKKDTEFATRKPRKERTCEEVEEEDFQEWCALCKGSGCIICTSGSQDQVAFGNVGSCVFYPCERARKKELKELERAYRAGTAPACKPFECPETDCPHRAHRLKMTKKNETALALLAVRPAPKAPKPKLLAIENVDFDACEHVAAEVEIAEVVVDDKLSLAAFITHSSEPTNKRQRKGEKKGLAVKPKAKPEAKSETKTKVNFWDAIDEDEGIPVDINVSHHKDKSTTTISFPEGVPSVEKIVYLAKIVGVQCTKGVPHIDQFIEVLSTLARKMKKQFSTNCTIDEEELTLCLRGSFATEVSEYLKKIDFADTVDSTAPVRTTTKAQASARGANKKAGKSHDTRDSGEQVLRGKK